MSESKQYFVIRVGSTRGEGKYVGVIDCDSDFTFTMSDLREDRGTAFRYTSRVAAENDAMAFARDTGMYCRVVTIIQVHTKLVHGRVVWINGDLYKVRTSRPIARTDYGHTLYDLTFEKC